MRLAGLTVGGLIMVAAFATLPAKPTAPPWALILGGDTDGYLSPCGCTSPMTGGIRRRATATRELLYPGRTVILDNGSLVAGNKRQDEIKAETMAQFLASIGAGFVNFGMREAAMGQGSAFSLQSLSNNRFGSSSLSSSSPAFPSPRIQGPFVIAGVSVDAEAVASPLSAAPVALDAAVTELVEQGKAAHKAPLLLLQGDRDAATAIAKKFPSLALIQYRSSGEAPEHPERVGNTVLATVGQDGKSVIRLTWNGRAFSGYIAVHLGPTFADDPAATRIYATYLARVERDNLLERLPRKDTAGFAGSAACAACHLTSFRVWKKSAHSSALATLERQHESKDPDCVPCHVTGLQSENGFRSRSKTPQLSFVGCESCHGPSLDHARDPRSHPLPKIGEAACISCHSSGNSPNFVFRLYWAKIRH